MNLLTASDLRIGERAPWNIAREIAHLCQPRARASHGTTLYQMHVDLRIELYDLVEEEDAERLIAQAKDQLEREKNLAHGAL